MLFHRQICWYCHIIRMTDGRLPHRVLYGKLRLGHRSVGGQEKCFKDHIKSILEKCTMPFSRLEVLASNKATWRSICAFGMSCFDAEYDRAAALRRSRRHGMLQCSAKFWILFINVHFVADNASHALFSLATVKNIYVIYIYNIYIFYCPGHALASSATVKYI